MISFRDIQREKRLRVLKVFLHTFLMPLAGLATGVLWGTRDVGHNFVYFIVAAFVTFAAFAIGAYLEYREYMRD